MDERPKNQYWVLREAAAKYGSVPSAEEEWVTAADFKTHCLRLIEQVRQGQGEVVITRYGKPVAKLVPYTEARPSVFGHLSGSIVSQSDDLISPIDEAWDVDA